MWGSGSEPSVGCLTVFSGLGAGEHEHTIEGYSLVKGIGDGEPIASERFTVGGHEWVSGVLTIMTSVVFVEVALGIGVLLNDVISLRCLLCCICFQKCT